MVDKPSEVSSKRAPPWNQPEGILSSSDTKLSPTGGYWRTGGTAGPCISTVWLPSLHGEGPHREARE
ncbi:unnamed protein product [Victoria cruziana]